jgi:hypothetical protein
LLTRDEARKIAVNAAKLLERDEARRIAANIAKQRMCGKKKAPTAGVEAEVCVFWPYGGRSSIGLVMPDAHAFDCRSTFCEVMVSTKRLSLETAKPSAVRSQRLCLRPPYVPYSRTASVGSSDHAAFASNPSAQESGRAARPEKNVSRTTAFLRLRKSALSSVEKSGPDGSFGAEFDPPGHLGTCSNFTLRCRRK